MKEIAIYIEGGGPNQYTQLPFRKGFDAFFNYFKALASENDYTLTFIPHGGREEVFKYFNLALINQPNRINILMVDAEGSIDANVTSKTHLQSEWDNPDASEEQCHLMVQIMESWFFADLDTLYIFYNIDKENDEDLVEYQGVKNVETIAKDKIIHSLINISKNSTHGDYKEYGKRRQAIKIFENLDLDIVRDKAPHCDKFCKTIEHYIMQY